MCVLAAANKYHPNIRGSGIRPQNRYLMANIKGFAKENGIDTILSKEKPPSWAEGGIWECLAG